MARATRNGKLENRTQRSKLKTEHRPYWVGIGQGLYLGYRKGIKGGSWIVRYYNQSKYVTQKLSKADDFQDSNNIDVLDYFQAQAKAREFANGMIKGVTAVDDGKFTVTDAINNYLEWFKVHRKSHSHINHVVKVHIIPVFGKQLVGHLTTKSIREWHESIVKSPARSKNSVRRQDNTSEQSLIDDIRKRKATANRILTVFKAALNHAWRDELVLDDGAWRKVKPFHNVDVPKIRYLELAECQRLINACDSDFRKLVRAALLTGCRYGELTRLKVNDFDLGHKTIFITETKNGKPRYIPLTDEGVAFFDGITAGKLGNSLIFLHEDGSVWGASHQIRRLIDTCKKASIKPAVSFHILRHTYGSLLASKGVPLQVIAELLGHSDTRITSKHYAHLMPSFVANTLRENLPQFIQDEPHKVLRLKSVGTST